MKDNDAFLESALKLWNCKDYFSFVETLRLIYNDASDKGFEKGKEHAKNLIDLGYSLQEEIMKDFDLKAFNEIVSNIDSVLTLYEKDEVDDVNWCDVYQYGYNALYSLIMDSLEETK